MYRVKERGGKGGAVILVFLALVMLAAFGCAAWLRIALNQIKTSADVVYTVTPEEYMQIITGNRIIQVDPSRLAGISAYNDFYTGKVLSGLAPIAFTFLLVLLVLSVGLWLVLRKIQAGERMQLVAQLNAIADNSEITGDAAFVAAYQSIQQKFIDHLNDYKRLNSYLSHDQKNAITLLRTNLEFAGNTEYLQVLGHISGGIDDILTLSENESDSLKQAVDVSLVCAQVCDHYKKVTDRIRFTFDEEDSTQIEAKEHWIYRAVMNLVDNALKYGQGKPVCVSVSAKNNSVIVAVKDSGIGIHPDLQETIFDNHYRVNELSRDGYGIGLSLVSHVCDLCGGYVTVCSEEGEGTTFYLSFPQKQ